MNARVEAAKVYSKECGRAQRCEVLWPPFDLMLLWISYVWKVIFKICNI